jgi:hypothetical protein
MLSGKFREQMTMSNQAHSFKGGAEGHVQRAVELAFGRLRLGRTVSDTVADEIVQLVDKGALDEAIARNTPPLDATAERRRYADSREFSHEDWKRRHGITD